MDAQQAVRLIEAIELRLAFAGIGEGIGDSAPWPDGASDGASDAACDGPSGAATRTFAEAEARTRQRLHCA